MEAERFAVLIVTCSMVLSSMTVVATAQYCWYTNSWSDTDSGSPEYDSTAVCKGEDQTGADLDVEVYCYASSNDAGKVTSMAASEDVEVNMTGYSVRARSIWDLGISIWCPGDCEDAYVAIITELWFDSSREAETETQYRSDFSRSDCQQTASKTGQWCEGCWSGV